MKSMKPQIKPSVLAVLFGCVGLANAGNPVATAIAASEIIAQAVEEPRASKARPPALSSKRIAVPELKPVPAALSTRLIAFPYQKDYVYQVKCKAGKFTNIELEADEVITGWYPSDASIWESKASADNKDLFIKPTVATAEDMPAKLKTNKRTYQLVFSVVSDAEPEWYQRVTWIPPVGSVGFYEPNASSYPQPQGNGGARMPASTAAIEPEIESYGSVEEIPAPKVRPENLNYSYRVEGTALFKPTMVFDDGNWTWFRMPEGLQTVPPLFELNAEGDAVLREYKPSRNGMYFVPRLMPYGALFKIDKDEVRIKNLKNNCGDGLFQRKCSPISIIGSND